MASPTEFRRLEALFHEIADLAADARRERLAALAADEPEVHAQLVRLLESDQEVTSGAFAPREPVSARGVFDAGGVRRPEAGDRLGPYRLVRELARGGMGVVFEAEQEAPLVRRVAVKLVRDDLAGPRILERFEAERSSVARMSHPAIAQVFDAGATPEGRPFLVMELVAGEPITAFCDRERLSTSERIRLFLAVCDAVRHAHQKGILHRDLKPGNVLVASGDIGDTGEPRVKVIDFGISKLVADEEAKPGLTRRGEIIGTPEYMSPEQARGEEIDTRSDVYALGVLLLELLTGRVPLADAALERASPLEIARRIESAPRLAPEALLPADRDTIEALAARRRSDPVRLRRELRGDLGLVLSKATHPEIERRYSSVEQLAADLGRYLAGHPIEARPDSVAYRARRFVARHTAGVVAAALVFAALVAATLFSTRMFLRADAARGEAETQRAAAERISAFLQEMLGSIDPQLARGRDVSLLRNVLDDAAGELEAGLEAAPAAAADIRLTIGRTYAAIGAEAEAEEQLRASLAQLKALAPPRPEKVAAAELALGSLLHNRDQIEEAEKLLRSAVARNRSLGSAGEAGLARSLAALAELVDETGTPDEATREFREALELLRRQPESDVETLATTLRGYGEHLLNERQLAEAEAPLREAIAVRRAAGEQGTSLVLPLETLGRWLRWSDRLDEATGPVREAVAIARRELPEDHPIRLEAISELANLEQHRGEHAVSESLYREALAAQRRVHGELHSAVATTTNNLASLLREIGRLDEAEILFAQAVAGYVSSFGADHLWVSIARFNRARTLFPAGRLREAEAELVETVRVRRLVDAESWQVAEAEVLLAACRVAAGDPRSFSEAAELLRAGLPVMRERYGDDVDRLGAGVRALATLERRAGNDAEADRLLRSLAPRPPGT